MLVMSMEGIIPLGLIKRYLDSPRTWVVLAPLKFKLLLIVLVNHDVDITVESNLI